MMVADWLSTGSVSARVFQGADGAKKGRRHELAATLAPPLPGGVVPPVGTVPPVLAKPPVPTTPPVEITPPEPGLTSALVCLPLHAATARDATNNPSAVPARMTINCRADCAG